MTDQSALPFSPAVSPRRWRVLMANGSERVVEAAACRIEHGTVIFSEAASLSLAIASGEWRQVEAEVLS